ncbi:hypothetical protein JMF97_26160 [Micromonospora fiedleri]|uniref:Uncharacterized protein n=1 Tax=Micromonospora fiedleri TaxID=1157498 RepID=A0ABS1UTX7_9ACTN|nr:MULTISPECIES: hypothetical protein [Micromonospora]MBL6279644.1 hypothetical protein [Micromonospora fiedleri]WSK40148.1 hypothetical protein OG712_16480 [Micromonospora maris]
MSLSDVYYSSLARVTTLLAAPDPAGGGGTVPQPSINGTLPDGLSQKVQQVLSLIAWGGTAAGVVGILITGAVMAISHKRGESSEHMSRLGMVLGGCILVATAGPIVSWVFGTGSSGT